MELPPIFTNLEKEERDYFIALAKTCEKELSMHENPGKLWEKDGEDWSNVTEHCLVEAARVGALADMLGLEGEVREKLISAAALHDFNKKEEIRLTHEDIAAGGSGRRGVLVCEENNEKILKGAGFSEAVISIARHVTGDPEDVYFIKDILDAPNLSQEGLAHLIMHYVDNYTKGSSRAEAASYEDGRGVNDIDRRNKMNSSNPAYKKMNEEGLILNQNHPFFKGMTRFEAAAALNHLIEKKFADIMKKNGLDIENPIGIPQFVDERIKGNIKKGGSY